MIRHDMKWMFAILVGFSVLVGSTHAGTKVRIGRNCAPADRIPLASFDHSSWDALLHTYVDGRGYVRYADWKRNAADLRKLDEYLTQASCVDVRGAARQDKLAFWINTYNAVTVKGILRDYPVKSIKELQSWLGGYHIWKDLLLLVDGRPYSLEQIEHQVLRPMGEPRIHFAIVCASVGCPKLRNEAYVSQRLEEQLAANARDFFADPAKFRANSQTGTVEVSPILKWFGDDFGADQSARLRAIAPYLPASSRWVVTSRVRLSYLSYDWRLNDQRVAVQARGARSGARQ